MQKKHTFFFKNIVENFKKSKTNIINMVLLSDEEQPKETRKKLQID